MGHAPLDHQGSTQSQGNTERQTERWAGYSSLENGFPDFVTHLQEFDRDAKRIRMVTAETFTIMEISDTAPSNGFPMLLICYLLYNKVYS